MSFRLRVLALVALVAVTATTATAWLVLRQASRQVSASASADQATIETITDALTDYGRRHGTWEGVTTVVERLHHQTGQRIRVVAETGEVVVDTDHFYDNASRGLSGPPISVNPRPVLELPSGVDDPVAVTLTELTMYRSGVLVAACLTRTGGELIVTDGPHGVPRYLLDQPDVGPCHAASVTDLGPLGADEAAVAACLIPEPTEPSDGLWAEPPRSRVEWQERRDACLRQIFAQRIHEFAPLPLRVYVGALDEPPPSPLVAGPAVAAAGLVAVLAVVGSLLVSRRVLRPIEALTSASRRLGAGDLSERVPVGGRDELAVLAHSFNRMADSLQRGEERQRRLVADVAHELRTPLANLRGYLEALKDGVVPPEPELFASLHEEALLQQRIVDDLQDLALAEAGALVYHRSTVDLGELLETCRTTHLAVADAAGVSLTASTAGPVPLRADPDRLRQVLGNLVTNAVRATPAGGAVTLRGLRQEGWAEVRVSDTGTGVAAAQLPYVFDRFWRADAARGRRTGGSGLGLAIARQIVTDHGGTISVASVLGAGSTFTVSLPVADAPPPEAPAPDVLAPEVPASDAPLPDAPLPDAPLPGAPLPGAPATDVPATAR